MTDQSSRELRQLRDEFQAQAKNALTEIDQRLQAAEKAEAEAATKALIARFTATGNLDALEGHEFIFLISNAKSMGHGPDSFLAAALDTLYDFKTLAGKDADISALFWGYKGRPDGIYLGRREDLQSKYLNPAKADSKEFLPVAKHILSENTPDKQSGKKRHYIIIGDGNCTDNLEHSTAILAAVALLNPSATLDFINCGNTAGNLKNAMPSAAVTKAMTHDEAIAAIMTAVKNRVTPDPFPDAELPVPPDPRNRYFDVRAY